MRIQNTYSIVCSQVRVLRLISTFKGSFCIFLFLCVKIFVVSSFCEIRRTLSSCYSDIGLLCLDRWGLADLNFPFNYLSSDV